MSDMASIPTLYAGQRARYLEAQLKFFKDGTRKEPGTVSRAAIHERDCVSAPAPKTYR